MTHTPPHPHPHNTPTYTHTHTLTHTRESDTGDGGGGGGEVVGAAHDPQPDAHPPQRLAHRLALLCRRPASRHGRQLGWPGRPRPGPSAGSEGGRRAAGGREKRLEGGGDIAVCTVGDEGQGMVCIAQEGKLADAAVRASVAGECSRQAGGRPTRTHTTGQRNRPRTTGPGARRGPTDRRIHLTSALSRNRLTSTVSEIF